MPIEPVPDLYDVPEGPVRGEDENTVYRQKADALMAVLKPLSIWLRNVALSAFGNANSARADAILTAADRVQTGEDRVAAALSAASSANAPGTMATSVTPVTIGLGLKAFTIQANKNLVKGVPMGAASRANKVNAMAGEVESYDPATGALVLDVTGARGSGEFTDWNLFVVPSPLFTEGVGLPEAVLSTAGPHQMQPGMTVAINLAAGVNVATIAPPNPPQGCWFRHLVLGRTGGSILTTDPNGKAFTESPVGELFKHRFAWCEITYSYEGAAWKVALINKR